MKDEEKEFVPIERFVKLLNDELRNSSAYREGMQFIDIGSGYDFLAPMLSITENQALDKYVFDRVSSKYTFLNNNE